MQENRQKVHLTRVVVIREQHASNAVSEVQTALNQAISSLNESDATNSQALEIVRQQLTRADEFLDQALTSANALRLPDQQ